MQVGVDSEKTCLFPCLNFPFIFTFFFILFVWYRKTPILHKVSQATQRFFFSFSISNPYSFYILSDRTFRWLSFCYSGIFIWVFSLKFKHGFSLWKYFGRDFSHILWNLIKAFRKYVPQKVSKILKKNF